MDMLKLYVVNRAKEASTWRGVIMLLTALGLNISPEMADAIIEGRQGEDAAEDFVAEEAASEESLEELAEIVEGK